ncbi:MAG: vWA domain-containing protein [Planctomycetota bacterium]
MLSRSLFALSAVAFALSFLPPNSAHAGNTWFLFDQSLSAGASRPLSDYSALPGFPLDEWAAASSHDRVRVFPTEQFSNSSDLSLALAAMSQLLVPSDRLYVVSDGRALSKIVDDVLEGVDIVHLQSPTFGVVRHIQCPTFFAGHSSLQVDILLHDNLTTPLQFAVESQHEMLTVPRFDFLQENHLQLTLRPLTSNKDFEFDITLNGEIVEHFVVAHTQLPPLKLLTPPVSAQQLQELLASGVSCVVEYPTASSIDAVAKQYRAFTSQRESRPTVICLLDVSGSMEGAGLDQAIRALQDIGKDEGAVNIQVIPFSSTLQQPLTNLAELKSIQAFGATDIGNALEQLSTLDYSPRQIVILSDGQSKTPSSGWRPLVQKFFAETPISVLPCSLVTEGRLSERLRAQVDRAALRNHSVGHLQGANFFDLAKQFLLKTAHIVFALNPRSNALYFDEQGHPLVAVDIYSKARLFSVAGTCDSEALRQLAEIENSMRQHKKLRRTNDGLLIYSSVIPSVKQHEYLREVRLVDATASQNLYIAEIDPSEIVVVGGVGLDRALYLQPRVSLEFSASPQRFAAWLESRSLANKEFNILALFCALSLFLAGYFVYHRN